MNMSRSSKVIAFVAALVSLVSCGSRAGITGTISDAPSSEVIIKLLDANRYEVLDTVRTDGAGHFSYRVGVEKGQPEFVDIFYKERKIAGLLLEAGDKAGVVADTSGNYVVEGSEGSVKLAEVEAAYAQALKTFAALAKKMESASTEAEYSALAKEMSAEYVKYYRSRVKYVMENSHSLAIIPVFYQSLGENLPLFAQPTDAILFSNAADSLEQAYPESRYVKALRAEADRRYGNLELQGRLMNAEEIGYPDMELPDINAVQRKLSDMDSKVVLIYFWSASQPQQNQFNVDFLKPLYEQYHAKGFDIYQVSFDQDKALWATAVKGQQLPWTNVCDSRGAYMSVYNINSLPAAYVIADGELVDGKIVDEASFRKLLDELLK